jgi:hypothetical protein
MRIVSSLIKQRGIQVLLIHALYLLVADQLPLVAHQSFYTISLFIKDLLMWMLPLTVGFFIAHVISSFEQRAPIFVLSILIFEALSNLCSVWYAYGAGHLSIDYLSPIQLPASTSDLSALWRIPLTRPSWWSADKGSLLGLVMGSICAVSRNSSLRLVIDRGKEGAQWILTRIFSNLIPIFVLGFVARMHQTRLLHSVVSQYGFLLIWLAFFLLAYVFMLFFVSAGFSFRETLRSIKNLFPAGALAFTSGCSISTMPWTIDGAGKNLQNPHFAKAIIPATTNIQQIGDCIINTFLCFLIYCHFYGEAPDLATWATFTSVFVLARFATAAVLGGAIFIMLPIYESYLSFNTEMIAIILAFNVILDPLVTSSNVMANGALCRTFERFWLATIDTLHTLFPKLAKKTGSGLS